MNSSTRQEQQLQKLRTKKVIYISIYFISILIYYYQKSNQISIVPTATVTPSTRPPLYFIEESLPIQPTVPLNPTVIVAAPTAPVVLAPRFPTRVPTVQPSVLQPVPQVQTGQTATTSQPTEEVDRQPKGNNHTILTHFLFIDISKSLHISFRKAKKEIQLGKTARGNSKIARNFIRRTFNTKI